MKCKVIILLCVTIYTHAMDMAVMSPKFDRLPQELHSEIVKNVFNLIVYEDTNSKKDIDQQRLKQYFLKIPIILGVKFSQEFHRLQIACQSEIGGKQFLARQLFILPREQRDVLIQVKNRSHFSWGDMDADGHKIIEKATEDTKKGLKLDINIMDKKVEKIQFFGGACLFIGGITAPLISPVIGLNVYVAPLVVGVTGFGLIGLCELLNLFNDNYRKDDPYWYLKKINY